MKNKLLTLLTLNTHSLIEEDYEKKTKIFVSSVAKILPDVFALQEVNQTSDKSIIIPDSMYYPLRDDICIKSDNHAAKISLNLSEIGLNYYWTYLPIKNAYNIYDEGLAVFSKNKISDTKVITLSVNDDYSDWKTRKALGVKVNNIWFYSVHFGWWKNNEFMFQWNKFTDNIDSDDIVFAMGDFNNPAHTRNEGYDYVKKSGWCDTYMLSSDKDSGYTASSDIAGWNGNGEKIRIDYIWCSKKINVIDSKVIFNGFNEEIVSDHFGVVAKVLR